MRAMITTAEADDRAHRAFWRGMVLGAAAMALSFLAVTAATAQPLPTVRVEELPGEPFALLHVTNICGDDMRSGEHTVETSRGKVTLRYTVDSRCATATPDAPPDVAEVMDLPAEVWAEPLSVGAYEGQPPAVIRLYSFRGM